RFSDATQASLEDVRFVFEFGGGYGNFCRLLFALGFKGQYVIFDLPHFSALQRFYLDAAGLALDTAASGCGVTLVSHPDEAGRILRSADLARSLFIATWSLSEAPLTSRDWIAEHLVRFSHLLLAYQNEFGGTDNANYFSGLRQRLQASHACRIEAIAHIPGNSYLFANTAGQPAEKVDRLSAPAPPARSSRVDRAARTPYTIPLMKNAFLREQESKEALAEFIRSADRLSMGEQCRRFEQAFAAVQGRRNAVLVNSGSSANLLLLQSLRNLGRLQAGDRVGFSALTWATNVMPIIQMGFEPVPIDCERTTLNVSSRTLLERLNETDLRAFFVTNALGFAGDLGEIRRICSDRGITLIEDNCEALGTELTESKTGNFGTAASFSFFVAHHMSTIEGGTLVTDDPELAAMFRMTRSNGWDRDLSPADQARLRRQHGINSELYAKYA